MSHPASRSRLARSRTPLLLCAGVGAFLLSGGCKDGPAASNRSISRVEVSAPASSVEAGRTLQLTAVAFNRRSAALAGKTFSWASSSEAAATVSQDGLVTGRAAGPVTITASAEGVSGTLALTVSQAPASRVAVTPAFATVDVGGTGSLRAAALTASGDT
ncbi:MAG TPA: Ig-like domain-containing protein, partial [Longimicrobiaceae bacterium]|nr:Ig-like domain-containing protein [Longimicrobiaceae bacterium]